MADTADSQPSPPPTGRRRWLRPLALGLVLVVMAAGIAWPFASRYERGHVSVARGAHMPCEGTHERMRKGIPLAVITPDLDCLLHFDVTNDSHVAVSLEQVKVALAGPEAEAGIYAKQLDGFGGPPRSVRGRATSFRGTRFTEC
jgi:hypothetical protein